MTEKGNIPQKTLQENADDALRRLREAKKYRVAESLSQKRWPADITAMYELAKAIASTLDFNELLKKSVEETRKPFNVTGCIIHLIEDGSLKVRASSGLHLDTREKTTVRMGEGIAREAAEKGKTIIAKGPEDFDTIAPNIGAQLAMCTPLRIGDEIIGTFGIYDKKATDGSIIPFDTGDMITLEGIASIIGIAIGRAILHERGLGQEREALNSKKEVEELKDYLQGLIENSADAIVTTDMDGIVRSWNIGAEKIYGYSKEESTNKFMPFIPDFLIETEKSYIEQVKEGKTIKGIETFRKAKDGRLIDVSLTLSPIKDSRGNIIGISGISRDITERKKAEKELLKKTDMLSKLVYISSLMRGEMNLDKLLKMVLTVVTMGDGFGFNRALLFLLDKDKERLEGVMGVGPADHEEAFEIWTRLSTEYKDLCTTIKEVEDGSLRKDSFMDQLCRDIEISLDIDTILTRSVKEKKVFNVTDSYSEPLSDPVFIERLGALAYAVLPLISKDEAIGVLWIDNLYSKRPITEHDLEFLKGFTDQIASAIENARLFEHVARTEQELENAFESILDMVFITSSDCTITKVNRAVLEKVGKAKEEIIGGKCYEIFPGMSKIWETVCHQGKTLQRKGPFVEEIRDTYFGSTFLVSSSPFLDGSEEIIGAVHIARDISEVKKLREKVSSAERMAALGEMAARVAHEIRNPLLSMGGFARRLEQKLEGAQREHSKIIVEEVSRLETTLNDILSFVRTARPEKSVVEINNLFDDIINLLEPEMRDKKNVIMKDIKYPIEIFIDYNRFKECILNLVTNANHATEGGSITIRAYKTTSSELDTSGRLVDKEEAIMEVEDNGRGINEEDISRIFDPFFTTRSTGTGLGLPITKRIIEEHGGKIEVESDLGRGTRFKIRLPLRED